MSGSAQVAGERGAQVPPRKAAFIDRDGVIIEDRGYVHRPADLRFITGSERALRALRAAGYLLVVITNQSGIARGLFSEEQYHQFDAHMRERLLSSGVQLDSVLYCPHLPDAPLEQYRRDCECRKPRAGMLQSARASLGVDMSQSILVGDRISDLQAGRAAGVGRCFLVRSGHPLTSSDVALADGVYDSLAACVAGLSIVPPN
jgi:D-glycero-D-manno-heptose 1,7-bisphosphate phosphatase